MKIIKTIFIILITLIIFDKLITLYLEYKSDLIDEGYYNIYNYDMNNQLIQEINNYINEEYFIHYDDYKELNLQFEKYPLLYNISSFNIKEEGSVVFGLKSENVTELIIYCTDCDLNEPFLDHQQRRYEMKKGFGANIVEISDNIYHVYYNPIFEF